MENSIYYALLQRIEMLENRIDELYEIIRNSRT